MDDRFEQEFYRSPWQRVLPVGPDGIQPYIRTARSSRLSSASPALRRPSAMLAGLARGMIAFRRLVAFGIAKGPLLPATEAPAERQRSPVRGAPGLARQRMREANPPSLSRAA